jgi:rubrerythrin
MYYSRLKPGQARHLTEEEALARQQGELICRDCGRTCEKKRAIKSYRQSLKCPHCGGFLERCAPMENGQAPSDS